MTSDAVMPETRLYGNWRRARGFGIGALGTGQTLTVFGVVLAPILAAYISPRAALLLGLIGVVVVGLVVVRVGGSTAAEIILRRVRFTHARSRGYADLSGGVLTRAPPQGGSARADGPDGPVGHRRRPRWAASVDPGPAHRDDHRGVPGQPRRPGSR